VYISSSRQKLPQMQQQLTSRAATVDFTPTTTYSIYFKSSNGYINSGNSLNQLQQQFFKRDFFLMYVIQHCFICRPSDSNVSEDAGIEPRTVANSALAVRPLG